MSISLNGASTTSIPEWGDVLIDQVIAATGVEPSDSVTIAGGNLDLLMGFVHHGFAKVGCAIPQVSRLHETSDLLVIPEAGSLTDLRGVLAGFGRCLSAGGMVVVLDRAPGTRRRRRAVRALLAEFGLSDAVSVPSGNGALLAARKPVSGAVSIAA